MSKPKLLIQKSNKRKLSKNDEDSKGQKFDKLDKLYNSKFIEMSLSGKEENYERILSQRYNLTDRLIYLHRLNKPCSLSPNQSHTKLNGGVIYMPYPKDLPEKSMMTYEKLISDFHQSICEDFARGRPNYISELITDIHYFYLDLDFDFPIEFLNEIFKDGYKKTLIVFARIIDKIVRSYFPDQSSGGGHYIKGGFFCTPGSEPENDKYGVHCVYTVDVDLAIDLQIREHIIQVFIKTFKIFTEEQVRKIFDLQVYRAGLRMPFCNKFKQCKKCCKSKDKDRKCRSEKKHKTNKCECKKREEGRKECEDCDGKGGEDLGRVYTPYYFITQDRNGEMLYNEDYIVEPYKVLDLFSIRRTNIKKIDSDYRVPINAPDVKQKDINTFKDGEKISANINKYKSLLKYKPLNIDSRDDKKSMVNYSSQIQTTQSQGSVSKSQQGSIQANQSQGSVSKSQQSLISRSNSDSSDSENEESDSENEELPIDDEDSSPEIDINSAEDTIAKYIFNNILPLADRRNFSFKEVKDGTLIFLNHEVDDEYECRFCTTKDKIRTHARKTWMIWCDKNGNIYTKCQGEVKGKKHKIGSIEQVPEKLFTDCDEIFPLKVIWEVKKAKKNELKSSDLINNNNLVGNEISQKLNSGSATLSDFTSGSDKNIKLEMLGMIPDNLKSILRVRDEHIDIGVIHLSIDDEQKECPVCLHDISNPIAKHEKSLKLINTSNSFVFLTCPLSTYGIRVGIISEHHNELKSNDEGLAKLFLRIYGKNIVITNGHDRSGYHYNDQNKLWEERDADELGLIVRKQMSRHFRSLIALLKLELRALEEKYNKVKGDALKTSIDEINKMIEKYDEYINIVTTWTRFTGAWKYIATERFNPKFTSTLNKAPNLFSMRNGKVIDLKTLNIRDKTREDYISIETKVSYPYLNKGEEVFVSVINKDNIASIILDYINPKNSDDKEERIVNVEQNNINYNLEPFFIINNGKYMIKPRSERRRLKPLINKMEEFMMDVCCNNKSYVRTMQKALGVILTGEKLRFFQLWIGDGENGKSTLWEILREVMGEYMIVCPKEVLLGSDRKNGPTPEIIAMMFVRGAGFSESGRDSILNAEMLKKLAGKRDGVTARGCYEKKFISFIPIAKLIILSNFLPKFDAKDKAMVKRILLFPFLANFVDCPEGDKKVNDLLTIYLDDVFAWLAEGAYLWYQDPKIDLPDVAKSYMNDYVNEMDPVERFLKDNTISDPDATCTPSEVQIRFNRWKEKNLVGISFGYNDFKKYLEKEGKAKRTPCWEHHEKKNVYRGFRLIYRGQNDQNQEFNLSKIDKIIESKLDLTKQSESYLAGLDKKDDIKS